MIEHTDEIKALAKSLATFQGQVHGVEKDSTNPHFKNRYASLEAVINAARESLLECGLTFTQAPGSIVNGAIEVTTMVMHYESGQWLRSTLHVPLDKTTAQGAGSAITYGCRYALMATLGLPPIDDDAESAARPGRKPQEYVEADRTARLAADALAQIKKEIGGCVSIAELKKFVLSQGYIHRVGSLPENHRTQIRTAGEARLAELKKREAEQVAA